EQSIDQSGSTTTDVDYRGIGPALSCNHAQREIGALLIPADTAGASRPIDLIPVFSRVHSTLPVLNYSRRGAEDVTGPARKARWDCRRGLPVESVCRPVPLPSHFGTECPLSLTSQSVTAGQ